MGRPVGKILRPGNMKDVLSAYFEIQKEEVFHLKMLYEYMHDWLVEEGWSDTEHSHDDKFEHYYLERRYQGGKLEHRFWWRMQKQIWDNSYYRYVLLINMRNVAGKRIETVIKGQKVGTFRGDLTMNIEAWLQLDYEDKWPNHWLMKHFDKLYVKRIYKKKKDAHKKALWRESYKFAGWLKQMLEMKVPFHTIDQFHPVGGVGPGPGVENSQGNK